ncbi:MAG: ATP-binding protein [Sulfitobacter sp.]
MNVSTVARRWSRLSLPRQFLLAGGVVMLVAMVVVGSWVSRRIEQAAVQNFAIIAANYLESFVSPIAQDLAESNELSDPAKQAMIEVFSNPELSERIVSYKIWKQDGLIVYASDPSIIGQRFEPSDDLQAAWRGEVAASFEDLTEEEDISEAALGISLLEVYSPIHEVFSGEIIAVAEFYERASTLQTDLRDARRTTWLVVGSVFLASGLLLIGIVRAGGRTIEEQRQSLQMKLLESNQLAAQNNALRRQAITANLRATAQMEQTIRRVGSDLHDGPAQHLSLAALRLDSVFDESTATNTREEIRSAIDKAMDEIRAISRGLALPELEELDMAGLVRRAVSERETQSGHSINVTFHGAKPKELGYTEKLCVYRFLQEGLSNALRHSGDPAIKVEINGSPTIFQARIQDRGKGFDTQKALQLRAEGGQGLIGLKDRAESIGGTLNVESTKGQGTTLTLSIISEEQT